MVGTTARRVPTATGGPPTGEPGSAPLGVLLLVATLAAATVAQGAFYGAGHLLVGLGIGAALLASLATKPAPGTAAGSAPVGLRIPAGCAAALALWAVGRAWFADSVGSGLAAAGLLAAMAAVVVVCRRAAPADRRLTEDALVAIGVLVAVAGWVGVALHLDALATLGQSTWRAASTLTYPNAAAALLTPAALLALARRSTRPAAPVPTVATTLLATGLVATQSRGGVLALVAGGAILAVGLGPRRLAAAVAAPVVGTAVATAGLLPGLSATAPARPLPALAGLLAGCALAALSARAAARVRRWQRARSRPDVAGRVGTRPILIRRLGTGPTATRRILTGLAVVAVIGTVGAAAATGFLAARRITVVVPGDRLSIGSADRVGAAKAAVGLFLDAPWTGVGPGVVHPVWTDHGRELTTTLVHDEYLQTAAALGVVGLAALAALFVSTSAAVVGALHHHPRWRWAGMAAALGALAVHSAFDFLWHVAVIPLYGAALVGLVTAGSDPTCSQPQKESECP